MFDFSTRVTTKSKFRKINRHKQKKEKLDAYQLGILYRSRSRQSEPQRTGGMRERWWISGESEAERKKKDRERERRWISGESEAEKKKKDREKERGKEDDREREREIKLGLVWSFGH